MLNTAMPVRRWWQWRWDEWNFKLGWGTCPKCFFLVPVYFFLARRAQLVVFLCAFLMGCGQFVVCPAVPHPRASVKLGRAPRALRFRRHWLVNSQCRANSLMLTMVLRKRTFPCIAKEVLMSFRSDNEISTNATLTGPQSCCDCYK